MTRQAALAVLGALACAEAAAAQTLGRGETIEVAWWRVLAALLLCLALGVAGALALRARLGRGAPPMPKFLWRLGHRAASPPRRLRLIENLRVSHQVDVCLMACDGSEFLVASSPQGVAIIDAPKGSTVA